MKVISPFLLGLALVAAACGDATSSTTSTVVEAATVTTTGAPATADSTVAPTTEGTAPPATTVAPATTTAPTTTEAPRADVIIEVTVIAGDVTAPDRPEIPIGSTVLLVVTADVTDEVHVHGYDFFLDIEPGVTGELEFVADIPGIFEIELETSHDLLLEIVVR